MPNTIKYLLMLLLIGATDTLWANEAFFPAHEFTAHKGDVFGLDFSRAGNDDFATISNWSPEINIWDGQTLQLKQHFNCLTDDDGVGATKVLFSAPELQQVAVLYNGDIIISDLRTAQKITIIDLRVSIDFAYHPTRALVAYEASADGIGIWDVGANQRVETFEQDYGIIGGLEYNSNGSHIYGFSGQTGYKRIAYSLWNCNVRERSMVAHRISDDLGSNVFKFKRLPHDDSQIVIGSHNDCFARLYNIITGSLVKSFAAYDEDYSQLGKTVDALAVSPHQKPLIAASYYKTATLSRILGDSSGLLRAPAMIAALAYSPSGRALVAACHCVQPSNEGAKVKVWDISEALQ
jgi:WD40 repeat protein